MLAGTWILLVSTRAHRELGQLNQGSNNFQGIVLAGQWGAAENKP